MRRRKIALPKVGDRIRFAVPLPSGHEPRVRYGTVLERSCGTSGALLVRWEPDTRDGRGAETWLPDAGWHWSRSHLRPAHAEDRRPAGAAAAGTAPAAAPAVDPASITPVRRAMRHRVAAEGVAGDPGMDAAGEWDAALEADPWLTVDHDWAALLNTALAPVDDFDYVGPPMPAGPPAAPPAAAPPPPAPVNAPPPPVPVAATPAAAPAPSPYAVPARVPPPAPPPAPAPAPAPADDPLGDIVPGRGRRR